MKGTVIGIDLGTTNSCVSYVSKDGQPVVIPNGDGSNTTPSIVAFTKNSDGKEERIVGAAAKRQAVTNAKNTVGASKRLMGHKANDPEVEKAKKHCSYSIVAASNGDARIDIDGKMYSPSEIGAQVLMFLKEAAEVGLSQKITDAVITVPAYFNDSQRQATKDAGTIAGLNVLRIINEPTAAALAYGLDKGSKERNIVIYDLGGGTFDVSILNMSDGVFEVKATNGDTFLGGEDFDNRIQNYLIEEFKKESGIDVSKDPMAMQRLKEAAEKAKIELSSRMETDINLPFLSADASGPKHMQIKLSRAKLNSLVEDLIQKTIEPCKIALKDSGLAIKDIDEVVMVGGMTRMPRVIEVVKEFFGKEPNRSANPDEVVAVGAAIQGAVLRGDVKGMQDIVLLDVTPLSLGLETMGGVMTKIIDKNTTIPCKKSQVFSTAEDSQHSVTIRVFQGERPMAVDNKLLGDFNLTGIPPAPRGVPQIEVEFDISADGILHVSAHDKGTGKKQNIQISPSSGLTDAEIQRMVKDAEQNAELDKSRKELADAKNDADAVISSGEKLMDDSKDKLTSEQKEQISAKIKDLNDAKDSKESTNLVEIQSKTEDLRKLLMEIGSSLYNQANTSGSSVNGEGEETEAKAANEEGVVEASAKED